MKQTLKKWAVQPIIHFLVIGLLVFVITDWRQNSLENASTDIQISEATVMRLGKLWEARYKRLPTDDELGLLIEDHVKEEIFYREALKLGLDKDDVIIRRRLAQKYSFLSSIEEESNTPNKATLKAWYELNADKYKKPNLYSFSHIFFKQGREAEPRAVLLLKNFQSSPTKQDSWAEYGDVFMLERQFHYQTQKEVFDTFGHGFAIAVVKNGDTGVWVGPYNSVFGTHLIKVSKHQHGFLPPLQRIRDKVLKDYVSSAQDRSAMTTYQSLRAQYDVSLPVEKPN